MRHVNDIFANKVSMYSTRRRRRIEGFENVLEYFEAACAILILRTVEWIIFPIYFGRRKARIKVESALSEIEAKVLVKDSHPT